MRALNSNREVSTQTDRETDGFSPLPSTCALVVGRQNPSQEVVATHVVKGNVFRLQTALDLQYDPVCDGVPLHSYRDAVCELCEKTVSMALSVPLSSMQSKTRCSADVALARQIAMYLSHTTFSILPTEIGAHFKRDRTTVSHACSLVESKRDNASFDLVVCQLEALLCDARHAMSICIHYDLESGGQSNG